jgi:hypothetical protein
MVRAACSSRAYELSDSAAATPLRCRWRALAKYVGAKIVRRQMAGGRAFAEILHNGIGSIFDFRFQLKAGSEAAIGDAAGIDPLFRQRLRTKRPKLSRRRG